MIFNRRIENGNVFYYLDGKEIARSFTIPKNEILNPAQLPEYQVRFLPESETVYGKFAGRNPKDAAVMSYIDHMIYQHFGNKGIHSEIIDTY